MLYAGTGVYLHTPCRLNHAASLAWLWKQLPCPLQRRIFYIYADGSHAHTHTWKHPEGRRWNEIKWTMSYNLMKFTGAIPNFKPTTNHKLNMTWQWTKSKYKAVLLLAACHTHALNANWKKKQSSPWSIGGHKLNGLSVLNPCHCATDASSLDGDMWSTLHPTPSPSSQNSVLCTCMEPFIAGL